MYVKESRVLRVKIMIRHRRFNTKQFRSEETLKRKRFTAISFNRALKPAVDGNARLHVIKHIIKS